MGGGGYNPDIMVIYHLYAFLYEGEESSQFLLHIKLDVVLCNSLSTAWYICKMMAQNRLCTCEEKRALIENNLKFKATVDVDDGIYRSIYLITPRVRALFSELQSLKSSFY